MDFKKYMIKLSTDNLPTVITGSSSFSSSSSSKKVRNITFKNISLSKYFKEQVIYIYIYIYTKIER